MRNSGHHKGTSLVGHQIETLVPLARPSAPNRASPGHGLVMILVGMILNNHSLSF